MAKEKKRGFFRRLADALFEEELVPVAPAAPAPNPAHSAEEMARAQFDAHLARLIEEDRDAVAGRLQFLDLDRLKEALGDRWEEEVERARALTRHVIEKRLAPGDHFAPHGDDGFLLLFVDLTPEQGRIKAEAIAQEVMRLLLGDKGPHDRHWVRAFVGEMKRVSATKALAATPPPTAQPAPPPGAAVEEIRKHVIAQAISQAGMVKELAQRTEGCAGKTQFIDLEAIKAQFGDRWQQIADRAQQIAVQVIQRRLAPTDVFAQIEDDSYMILFAELTEEQARLKVQAIARQIQDRLLGELDVGDRHKVKAFVTGILELPRSAGGVDLKSVAKAIEATGDVAPPPRAPGVSVELQTRLGEVGVTYTPTWAVRKQAVSMFHVRVLRLDQYDEIKAGPAAYPRQDPPVTFEIDRGALTRALTDLRRLCQDNGQAMIAVPLRLQSLIGLGGGQLIDLCRAVPPEVRRFLLVEIVLPNAAGALPRIGEAVAAVQPFCRGITMRIPVTFAAFEILARHRVMAISVDLEEVPTGQSMRSLFPALVQGAHGHRMTAGLLGVGDIETARAGQGAGFDFLAGPGIAHQAVRPVSAYAYRVAL